MLHSRYYVTFFRSFLCRRGKPCESFAHGAPAHGGFRGSIRSVASASTGYSARSSDAVYYGVRRQCGSKRIPRLRKHSHGPLLRK